MTKAQEKFITNIYRACKQHGRAYNNICPIAVTAQAVCESRWGQSSLASKYHNYFGLKSGKTWHGKSVRLKTKEEYQKGKLVTIYDNFRVFDDLESGVIGYYEFTNTKRYSNLKNIEDPLTYLMNIRQDGYATSYKYVETVFNIVNNIKDFLIALEVINNEWGNGQERKLRLTMKGYDYKTIQKIVNRLVKEGYGLDIPLWV